MKKGRVPIIIMIAAVVLLIALAFFSARARTIPWLENFVGSILRPVQTFAFRASDGISSFFRGLFNTTDADIENARLKQELALFEQLKLDHEELKKENERLSELLNYSNSLNAHSFVTASVVGKSSGVWFDIITVNAGRDQGVEQGMPVISGDGLVGRVTDVGSNWCKVTCVIDATVNVAVMVERTRDNCMVRGVFSTSRQEGQLELYYLPTDLTDLVPGDEIMTSGLGGVYPKGIRVGIVSEVMLDADTAGINAVVTPSVDFLHLEEVMVITDLGGED